MLSVHNSIQFLLSGLEKKTKDDQDDHPAQ